MTPGKEAKPDIVSGSSRRPQTRPDGEVRTRWAWTEPSVWTRRMLTALDNGVRAGTNAYFASCGLFSLRTAYELDRQSSLR